MERSNPEKRHGPLAGLPRWQKWLISTIVLAAAVVGTIAVEIHRNGAYFFVSCNLDTLQPHGVGRASYIYSADGVRFATVGAAVIKQPVALNKIDPKLAKATIDVEDRRFYHEGGTDWIAMIRATVADVTSANLGQGGSTLTQQLVRNLYLSPKRTIGRKLQEGCLADQLARRWSKSRVLDTYLNTVFYGQEAYGVQAAAMTYFSRPAAQLTLAQAALLAGLPQAPSAYDPLRDAEAAKARRQQVLQAMLTAGDINRADYREAERSPLGLKPSATLQQQPESFFVNYVYSQLVDRYGAAAVRQGGLAIHTTLRWKWQKAAERAIHTTLNRPHDPAAALVSIDPATGAVQTMASIVPGKPSYQFNLAVQGRRQAGSSFKLFVLTDAILRGINPFTTKYLSAPFRGPWVDPYLIQTDTHTYTGRTPIDQATAQSDNTVFVRLTLDLGPQNIADLAHRMGVQSNLRAVPTIGLGVNPVSPFEMASAYATVSDGGVYHQPYAISSVTFPDGHTDNNWRPSNGRQVIPQAVAYEVTRVLEEVITHGTGTAAALGRPAAGKTGTTESLADAWFDGYTPGLAAAVWVGYPQARVPMKSVHGIEVFGGTFPAKIWRTYMSAALSAGRQLAFVQPGGTVQWHKWCGRFQFARNYANARAATSCAQTTTVKTTPTTTTSGTTTRRATTTVTFTATTPRTHPTTTTAPPPPPPTTTEQTTTEQTTTQPATTTTETTTTTSTTGG
ncbi:MAG: transglycosylase domain-containing protein [Gaiellaceae bacterium]